MKTSVLIPWRSDDGPREQIFSWVLSRLAACLPSAEIIIADDQNEPFSRGGSRNEAFNKCTGDVIVVADADTAINVSQLKTAIEYASVGVPWVIPYETYYNLTPEFTAHLLTEPHNAHLVVPATWEHKITSWAGMLVMPRSSFEAVHGYDSRFIGWSYEDNAFQIAMDTLVGAHVRLNGFVSHLWHPAPQRMTWKQPYFERNRALFRRYEAAKGDRDAMRELVEEACV